MDTDATVTMWMPLVAIPAEIGSMTFVTGSHRMGDLRGRSISDESDAEFAALIAERDLPCHTYGAVAAGDATFHRGWTIHAAGANPTDQLRPVMTVIYVADGARVAPTSPRPRTSIGGCGCVALSRAPSSSPTSTRCSDWRAHGSHAGGAVATLGR